MITGSDGPLDARQREALLGRLREGGFDLLVIGGGITGAGIALDAASRGLRVALLEKKDFASGTSSKSTKLIHGGLRYLKQLEFGLVREVGRERAIVHRLAPHLVTAEKMLLPLVKGGTYGKWSTAFGLWVYDVLAGVGKSDQRLMLGRQETLDKEPLLRADNLKGSGFYAEYRTDDARLTVEILKTAARHGAVCLNYVAAQDFLYDDHGKLSGVQARDERSGNSFRIGARFTVNAAGPWVDELRSINRSRKGKRLFLSKGVHIVVPHHRFPIRQAIYFDSPDGRMIFAVPRLRVTYIGTTDTPYDGDLDRVPVDLADVEYLLRAVQPVFPQVTLSVADVESSWAGLRPLIYEEGKSASEMSRKDEIFESESGLISIAGGKLTGYRKMAERIVDRVAARYFPQTRKKLPSGRTDHIPLTEDPFPGSAAVSDYREELSSRLAHLGLDSYHAAYLTHNYGRQTERILDRMQGLDGPVQEKLVRSEVWYAVCHELALTLEDFFYRRTGRLYFDRPGIPPVLEAASSEMAGLLNWSDEHRQEEEERMRQGLRRAVTFSGGESESERSPSQGRDRKLKAGNR